MIGTCKNCGNAYETTEEPPENHYCPGGLENEIVEGRCCTSCGASFESVRADDALCKRCLLRFKDRLYRDLMKERGKEGKL